MKKGGKKKKPYQWIFMFSVFILYLVLYFLYSEETYTSFISSLNLMWNIIPILVVVFILMALSNYFLKPKDISKQVGETSGAKGWIIAIVSGILSHGPIYVWFPLLKDLKGHGMRDGLVAAFLYNRSIKLPLLPVMIYYFGWIFVAILMTLMIVASIIEGKLIEIIDKIIIFKAK